MIFVLLLVSSVSGYNIKINPIVKTSVTNLKNTGDNNSIQLSTITKSTILQAVPQKLYQSHYNELLSTSVILVIFSFLFIILSVIITKITLVLFKLNKNKSDRSENSVIFILCFYLNFSEKSPF